MENREQLPLAGWSSLALFLFLVACYLLFYTGSYYSIDEMAMFNMAETLLKEGQFSVDQLNWIEISPAASIGNYGPDGRLYTKVAQTQAIVALPLVWLARHRAALGQIQTAFLANVFLTALNGVLIYRLGRRLGYRDAPSLAAALLYGLATIALPYTRTFLSEPLSGLSLLGALSVLVAYRQEGELWRPALAGVWLGVAAATRLVNLVLVPFYGLYLLLTQPGWIAGLIAWWRAWRKGRFEVAPARQLLLCVPWRPLIALAAPVLLAAGLIAWYNASRFAVATEAGYARWDAFSASPLTGLYGLLLSPGKSLFLYTPLYLATLLLLPRFARQRRAEGLWLAGVTVGYLLALSLWSGFSGGWAWGPRLLVPLAPLWALPLLELLPTVRGSRHWQIAAGLLVTLSLAVQLLGSVVDAAEWLRTVPEDAPDLATVFAPRFSALLGHWEMAQAGKVDLAWLRRSGLDPVSGLQWPALAPLLAFLLITGAGLLVLGLIGLPWVASGTVSRASFRLLNENDVRVVAQILEASGRPGDGIVSAAVTHSQPFQNLYDGTLPIYGTRNNPPDNYPPEVEARLAQFVSRYERLWLLLEWTPTGSQESGLEQWLAGRAFRATEWAAGGLRLVLYDLRPGPAITEESWRFGEAIELQGYGLAPARLEPGEMARLALVWVAVEPPDQDYTVFIHVENAAGELVAQVDRPPLAGLRPTSGWVIGEPVSDTYGLLLDETLPAGRYSVWVGLYAWPSLERLPIWDAAGQPAGDRLKIVELEIRD
ncbi:MAG: hypothetical protein L0346_22290 [Chloroflexi bacterium]|nr:hypothetical protein [Chloroflexota bacterium]